MSSSPVYPTPAEITDFLATHYEVSVSKISNLPGEVDLNYRIDTDSGQRFVLKIAPRDQPMEALGLQLSIMEHLAGKELSFVVPSIVKAKNGQSLVSFPCRNKNLAARLQKWVAGVPLGNASLRSPDLLRQWGIATAEINLALADFDHPAAHRFYAWNPSECLAARSKTCYFASQHDLDLANYFFTHFQKQVLPVLPQLRRGVNYNDAHELNLLVKYRAHVPQISGLIDLGDALYCETINELAIACAYAGMGLPDPLTAFAQVTEGFHAIRPLEEKEVAVLFGLIAGRLLISVAQSAENKQLRPNNPYLTVSEKPAWDLLRQMRDIHPDLAHYRLRAACGWEAVPQNTIFRHWADQHAEDFYPIMQQRQTSPLDCTVGSLSLGNNANFIHNENFAATIRRMIREGGGELGVGGYGEVRPFYTTDAFQSEGNDGPRWRSVHLGYDLWTDAGSPVYCPWPGRVHSFHYDPAPRSYGATILLEHSADNLTFYTLFGHLSRTSIEGLQIGQNIDKGQQIATLGTFAENGGWPPHLHFQLMLDTIGWKGDFPGVAYPETAKTWLSLCPDPRRLMPPSMRKQLGFVDTAIDVVSQLRRNEDKLIADRKEHLGPGLSISYHQPLHVVRGFMAHLYSSDGRRYLDTVNNVAHVGHEHPAVVVAGQRQLAVLNTNTRYLHENLTTFARELLATFPPALSVVHFVNSGSEANELALRMARTVTGSRQVIAMEMGYHGNTGNTIDVSSYKFDRRGGGGAPAFTHLVPVPDVYRGEFTDPATAGPRYAGYVDAAIRRIQEQGRQVGAFLCESILSCGGQIVLPDGFLPRAYASIRAAGGICIADEVQVGLGRTGRHWWAFEEYGVIPDIVTLGKPLGNGHPLAAVICTSEVARGFNNGMEYFNTFGGNPVSCAIGRAVLQTVRAEGLRDNALQSAELLKAGLTELQLRYPMLGDIRGRGLFLGVELVTDPTTKVPATDLAAYIKNQMRRLGVLMSTDGPDENVLKIKPPLCFNGNNVDQLLTSLERILQGTQSQKVNNKQ